MDHHNTLSRCNAKRQGLSALLIPLFVIMMAPEWTLAQVKRQTDIKLRAIADGVLKEATFGFIDNQGGGRFSSAVDAPPDAHLRLESRYNDWRYWNGVLNISMLRLGLALNDSNYCAFPDRAVAFCFDNVGLFKEKYKDEGKWNYPLGQLFTMEELDDCGAMGASLIDVYRRDKQARYLDYINLAADHIEKTQARLNDGTLVRSFPRQWTLWADDLYMSVSFLSRMAELSGDERYFDDATQQVVGFHKYLFDEHKELLYHCWYSDTRHPGVAFWGRANGWAILAQVDLLDRLPKNYRQRDTLLALLRRDIRGIVQYQGENGLWHQLIDKTDSYEETSSSAMFTYAIARSVNEGYVEAGYAAIAERGWNGVLSKIRADGRIEGVCSGTGVGDSLQFYYKRPTPLNDEHGIGAVLLAGVEMRKLLR